MISGKNTRHGYKIKITGQRKDIINELVAINAAIIEGFVQDGQTATEAFDEIANVASKAVRIAEAHGIDISELLAAAEEMDKKLNGKENS